MIALESLEMPADTSTALLIALGTGISWVISMVVAFIKGQEWIEKKALAVLKSEAGRKAILGMNRDYLEIKFDGVVERIAELGSRINSMSNKLERRLDKLDADMQAVNVRVTVLEQRQPRD